jgi:hypothetical protein
MSLRFQGDTSLRRPHQALHAVVGKDVGQGFRPPAQLRRQSLQIPIRAGAASKSQSRFFVKVIYKNNNICPPGVDIKIAIFCDFCQFSAKNWRFSFQKTNVNMQILQKNSSSLNKKLPIFFAKCFGDI